MARVSLNDVSKTFGDRTAVCELNLEIDDGELLVLVGPSGCGKTTTLRLISGLEQPTCGTVCVNALGRNDAKRPEIAMVFQHSPLYSHLTVRENLWMGFQLQRASWFRAMAFGWFGTRGRVASSLPPSTQNEVVGSVAPSASNDKAGGRRRESDQLEQRIAEVCRLLQIDSLLNVPVDSLSGGERQRVALGSAMVKRSDVLLMDEPFANLDAPLRRSLCRILKAWQKQERITTVLVTHDPAEAITVADRVVVMDQGRIVGVGATREMYAAPEHRLIAETLSDVPLTYFRGRVTTSGTVVLETGLGSGEGIEIGLIDSGDFRDRPIVLGWRGQDLLAERIRAERADLDREHGTCRYCSASGEVCFSGIITGSEWLGGGWYITVGSQITQMLSRLHDDMRLAGLGTLKESDEVAEGEVATVVDQVTVGDWVSVRANISQMLVFDEATGRRLMMSGKATTA